MSRLALLFLLASTPPARGTDSRTDGPTFLPCDLRMETPVPPSNAAKRHRVCVDKDVAIVSCVDGEVAMSAAEFHRLLDSGNVLRQLIYGGEGMIEELNLDVFRRFGVTVGGLCAIRACVRSGGVLPDDEDALARATSGTLRSSADALGGFAAVDTALKSQAARKTESELLKHRNAERPSADRAAIFQWRSVFQESGLNSSPGEAFSEVQDEGFEWASQEKVGAGHLVHGYIHHFRRLRSAVNDVGVSLT